MATRKKRHPHTISERFSWLTALMRMEPRPSLAEIAVAIVLAEHFNQQKGFAWPSERRIEAHTRMQRRNLRLAIARLIQRGVMERVRQGNRSRSHAYALLMPEDENSDGMWSSESDLAGPPTTTLVDAGDGPHVAAAQRPEQVSRSESGGKPHSRTASVARSAKAPRAYGGAGKNNKQIGWKPDTNFRP